MPPRKTKNSKTEAKSYRHPTATSPLRPDVGTQAQFKKKKPSKTYRYDSSLSPALDWDGQNSVREQGEALLKMILDARSVEEAKAAAEKLKALGRPFLNWAGKAERLSFDVPTLPLFVHERLSTKAIIETLRGHKKDSSEQMALFADPQHPITDQVLRAYEHRDEWVNRLILGDSLVVMNSLLRYESLGGQVQVIYMDPPYGVSFGSNFQPFIRRRDVKHNDDDHMTREPEMVQAYRDTWELGLHSYLSYLRDRLLLCREMLHASGSVFVQISDDNQHHVRELLDEVFHKDNFVALITFRTKIPLGATFLPGVADYILWYAKDVSALKFRRSFTAREVGGDTQFTWVQLLDGSRRRMTLHEKDNPSLLPAGARPFRLTDLVSSGRTESCVFEFELDGKKFSPSGDKSWKTNPSGMQTLIARDRIMVSGRTPSYVFYQDDYPVQEISNMWADTQGASDKLYVVQTATKVVQRCMLMATDPGDLVFDPTCGSGTTAYVAEQWGRRWITADTSRVPLALARQRILTATFPWYQLKDSLSGPSGGFVYERRKNDRGEEVGGIVPHVTLGAIAQEGAHSEEVIVDRPEVTSSITRVSGPFTLEASIPTPVDWEGDGQEDSGAGVEDYAAFAERMLEVLRRSPVLRLQGNRTVALKNIRPPAKTLSLSAEAMVENGERRTEKPVAFVFGPENGAVSQNLVFQAAREANAKNYSHLYVIGFGIQPTARELVENCASVVGVAATYVEATRDLHMGDLLKNMRSSQIFSVCGLPEVKVHKARDGKFQVELLGLDVLDPVTMELDHRGGDDVPAWLLDTDYNDLSFHVTQAFFPRTSAWENLKKALKTDYAESVWDHLAGTTSAPFEAGEHGQIAVKVIDDRGNELLVVKKLSEAKR